MISHQNSAERTVSFWELTDSMEAKMDSMEAKLDTKIDGLKGEIVEVLKNFVTEKTPESENASHEIHDEDTRKVNQEWRNSKIWFEDQPRS
jgi:hypothetical protein